jgi:hypothetical protein
MTFPASYQESRARFARTAAQLGAAYRQFRHDQDDQALPTALSTDVAYLGPADAATLIVIASGTHGVEGYAGAACQLHFMETWQSRFAASGVAFLLVHAVNPWGYLHDRRVTPEGVDLNRNFVDFPLPHAAPSAYRRYHARLVDDFRPLPRGWWNELRLLASALTARRRRQLQAAVTAGQYDCPDGLFYGGAAPTRSRIVWDEIVRTYAAAREHAVLLDIHTGLGERGAGELISYLPPSAPAFREMSGWFDGELVSMQDGESVTAAVDGTLTAAFDRTVGDGGRAIGLEFGTRAPLSVLNALRADHWYHNNADSLPQAMRGDARRRMKAAFLLSDPDSQHAVLARFDQVMRQLVAALAPG